MTDAVELWEHPKAEIMYMLAGWRQWADAGNLSSGLPKYLAQRMDARQIGKIRPDGFYLFQFPGTHDLVRPSVRFKEGYPEELETPSNDIYYAGDAQRGVIFFIGDEPHLDAERYVNTLLDAAKKLGVQRIITFGGVYGELPYDKARMISCIYSLPKLREQTKNLGVNLSDYQGGASIGSYICRRAGDRGMEMFGFYGFVPMYDFSNVTPGNNTIRIENDFAAWLGVMQRVNYLLKLDFDLTELEEKNAKLLKLLNEKIAELDESATDFDVAAYFKRLSEEFTERTFDPLEDVWEDELKRLFDKFDDEDQ